MIEELSVVLGLILGALYEFARFGRTPWGPIFLFNGDSLLLPLLDGSIARHEHFHWVFSAPLFFFPEAPLYFVCDLLTPSVQWALIVNGVVNILLIVGLIRLLAQQVTKSRYVAMFTSIGLAVVVFGCVVAEQNAQPQGGYASLLLFNTYYFGVVFSGLLVVYTLARFDPSTRSRANTVVIGIVVVLVTATATSDPLFLIQVVAPLIGAVIAMVVARNISLRAAAALSGAIAGGALLSVVLRATVFKGLIAADVNGYLKGLDLGHSLAALRQVLALAMDDPRQRYEILLIGAVVAGATLLAVRSLIARRGTTEPMASALVVYFAALSTPAIVGSVLVSDNVLTRYMIPVVIFPFLAFLPSVGALRIHAAKQLTAVAATIGLLAFAFMGVRHVNVVRAFAAEQPTGAACLRATLARHGSHYGVANYWRARALDVYADGPRVLQVNLDFTAFRWLINVGSYEHKDFTFVLVDTPLPAPSFGIPAEDAVSQLGAPTSSVACGAFDVYFYDAGSPGHAVLNQRIDDSIT